MARKRLATVEEAILVHLLDNRRHFDVGTAPINLTQAGISNAIGVRRSHVSSSLDTAKAKGLVEETLAHVKGEKRRRKCYSLTPSGLELAKKADERLSGEGVTALLPDGTEFSGTVGDLLAKSSGSMNLARLVLLIHEGVADLPRTDTQGPGEGGTVPDNFNFVGRREELELSSALKTKGCKIYMVRGIPGIGKTALAAEMVRSQEIESETFWFALGEWSSPGNTARHLALHLESRGFTRLSRYLEAHETPDLADVGDILADFGKRLILVFDDCQNCTNNMANMLKMLISVCDRTDSVKMILIGRELPDILRLDRRLEPRDVVEIELGVLPPDQSLDLLLKRDFGETKARTLAEQSGGHPLYLTLVGEGGASADTSTLVSQEVYSSLKENEKEMLHALSVFREPVGQDAFVIHDEDFDSLVKLEKRCLLTRTQGWAMHNLLRDFFYQRQTESDRISRHERAAEYYNARSTEPASALEETYHLLKAGDTESAMLTLSNNGLAWLHHGLQDEILSLVDMVGLERLGAEDRYDIHTLKANAYDQIGDWTEAERSHALALKLAEDTGDDVRVCRSMRHLATIQYRRGELDRALQTFRQALVKVGTGESELIAEIQNGIGVVQWRIGDVDSARKAYETDLEVSTRNRNWRGRARALNNLGILDWQVGDHDAALEKYALSLELAEAMPDRKLVAILYSNIADAYKAKSDSEEARKYYERCLELAEDLRFNWQVGEAHRCLADIDTANRARHLETAHSIFDRLGAKEDAKIVKAMMD